MSEPMTTQQRLAYCPKQAAKTPAIPWHNGDPCISCGALRSEWMGFRKVEVWCSHPDHQACGDHALTEQCVRPWTYDEGGPPDVEVRRFPDSDGRARGPTWADGVFSEDKPWPEVDQ